MLIPGKDQERTRSGRNTSIFVLNIVSHLLTRPTLTIYNTSLAQGILPNSLKISYIKPILKCKPAKDPKEFRLDALTSVMAKCLVKLLKHFIPPITDPNWHAYCRGRSIEDALFTSMDTK